MSSIAFLPLFAASLVCLSGCDFSDLADQARFSRDFHFNYPLNANGRLSIETFNGSVEVSGWDQNTIDISGTKYGPTQQEADDLPVSIDHAADAVNIRVVRPSTRRNNQGARFVIKLPRTALMDRLITSNGAIRTIDGAGPARLKTSNGAVRVEHLQGRLDIQTSNGGVELIDIDGDVTAHTSNGRVRAERVRGTLDATSSNGSIVADVVRNGPVRVETSNSSVELNLPADFSRDVRASTSNGGITVRLPEALNARVIARTSNSRISSDFDLQMRGEISKNRVDATIGSGGGPLIDLSTSNGGIRLAKR
jgi:DUF4097 and DUF4098 domain-containing protein YvlB